jgi:hypothetical protein
VKRNESKRLINSGFVRDFDRLHLTLQIEGEAEIIPDDPFAVPTELSGPTEARVFAADAQQKPVVRFCRGDLEAFSDSRRGARQILASEKNRHERDPR